jgi:hypothetical protein
MGLFSSNSAVTEVLSTVLLLVIATAVFGSLSYMVINSVSSGFEEAEPVVTIVGFVEGNTIILEHRGGHSLSSDRTEVSFTVDDDTTEDIVKNFMEGSPSRWSIGQQVFTDCFGDLSNKRITALVIDKTTGSILFNNVIRTGFEGSYPNVTTLPASDYTSSSIKLHMQYVTYGFTTLNRIWFEFRKLNQNWEKIPDPGIFIGSQNSAMYSITVENIQMYFNTYEFRACIGFVDSDYEYHERYGDILSVTLLDERVAYWKFDETAGTRAEDSSSYNHDGEIHNVSLGETGILDNAFGFIETEDSVMVESTKYLELTQTMSLSAWVNPNSDSSTFFKGDLSQIKQGLVQNDFLSPSLVHINYNMGGNKHVYAVAYHTQELHGKIMTVSISDEGDIQEVIADVDVVDGVANPEFIAVSDTIYAVIWESIEEQNIMITPLHISDDGADIGKIIDDPVIIDTVYGKHLAVEDVGSRSGYQFYIVSSSDDQLGYSLFILKISHNGKTIVQSGDSYFTEKLGCIGTDVINVGSNMCAVISVAGEEIENSGFEGDFGGMGNQEILYDSVAEIQTFKISSTYDEIKYSNNNLLIEIPFLSIPSVTKNKDETDLYAIGFGGVHSAVVTIVQISHLGSIKNEWVEFYIDYPLGDSLVLHYIKDDVYMVAGSAEEGIATLVTFVIHGVDVNSAYVSSFFKGFSSFGVSPDILYIHKMTPISVPQRYLIVYGGNSYSGFSGFFGSFRVYTSNKVKPLISKPGSYELVSTDSRVFVYLNDLAVVSADILTNQWNFIVFTFKNNWAHLYINGVLKSSNKFSQNVHTNTNAIRLGGLVGVMDEVAIYMDALAYTDIQNIYNQLK